MIDRKLFASAAMLVLCAGLARTEDWEATVVQEAERAQPHLILTGVGEDAANADPIFRAHEGGYILEAALSEIGGPAIVQPAASSTCDNEDGPVQCKSGRKAGYVLRFAVGRLSVRLIEEATGRIVDQKQEDAVLEDAAWSPEGFEQASFESVELSDRSSGCERWANINLAQKVSHGSLGWSLQPDLKAEAVWYSKCGSVEKGPFGAAMTQEQ